MKKLAIFLLALTACDLGEVTGSARYKEEFHSTHALEPGGRLSVESFNGPITITGWDRPEVEVSGTRYAASQELLDALEVDVAETSGAVRIRAIRPSGWRGNMGARFEIHAPHRVRLDRVTTSNGSVEIEGIEGDAYIETTNGRIHVADMAGNIEAKTTNASIHLTQYRGSAALRTSNGGIEADAIHGHIEASTSNAGINVRVAEAASGRPVRLSTSNGRVNLVLEQPPGDDVLASTSNASIKVTAPAAMAVRLKADTSNASIQTDFEVDATIERKTRLEGSVNGGGPLLDLATSNGGIELKQL